MKVRNYKNYTAVYLEEITSKEFKESMKKYTELKECEKYVFIRPTKKAAEAFAQLHSLLLSECKKGASYRILNLQFTVLNVEQGLVTFSYFNRHGKKETITPFVQNTAPIGGVLIETLFTFDTGKLLYF